MAGQDKDEEFHLFSTVSFFTNERVRGRRRKFHFTASSLLSKKFHPPSLPSFQVSQVEESVYNNKGIIMFHVLLNIQDVNLIYLAHVHELTVLR